MTRRRSVGASPRQAIDKFNTNQRNTMTNEEKNAVREQVAAAATQGAKQAAAAAKKATGWKKWALVALAVILAGLAAFTQTQCKHLPPVNVTPEQVQQAHEVYHVLTGKDCILVLPVEDYKK